MIPTARVQRGSSETARCASTGIVPATPSIFSILLEEGLLLFKPFNLTHQLFHTILQARILQPKQV